MHGKVNKDLISESKCRKEARSHFQTAYDLFLQINHIKGQHLAIKSICILLESLVEVKIGIMKEREELRHQEHSLRIQFEAYCKDIGIENSCYIQREQGDEISLMSEIVKSNVKKDMFKREMAKMLDKKTTPQPLYVNTNDSAIDLQNQVEKSRRSEQKRIESGLRNRLAHSLRLPGAENIYQDEF